MQLLEKSVNQIILILEMEGRAAPRTLCRSTLQRHLFQADIKYGPKLPIGKNGAKIQTYLSAAIDDHSRFIISFGFYDNQEVAIVEDTFHKAILTHGKFESGYVDYTDVLTMPKFCA